MPNILLLTKHFPPDFGSIENVMFGIAKQLATDGHNVTVLAPKHAKQSLVSVDSFDVIRSLSKEGYLASFFGFKRLAQLLPKRPYDYIVCSSWELVFFANYIKRQQLLDNFCLPHIVTLAHGRELLFNPFLKIPLLSHLYPKIRKLAFGSIDHCFPNSRYTKNLLRGLKFPLTKTTLIYTGINTDFIKPCYEVGIAKNWENKRIIITVCNLVKHKGIETILDTLPEMFEDVPDLHFLIVGEGPEKEGLKNEVKKRGLSHMVEFLGTVSNKTLVNLYTLADIFVLTPIHTEPEVEGLGLAYIEAMACGTQVIGSNVGGIPDAITHRVTGLIVPPRDPDTLRHAMLSILTSPPRHATYLKLVRHEIEERFNFKTIAKKIIEFKQTGTSK